MDKLVIKNGNPHFRKAKPPDGNETVNESTNNESERVTEAINSDNEITFS